MFLTLLRMSTKQWTEYIKEMNHRFPRSAEEYRTLQQLIISESTLTEHIGALGRTGGRSNLSGGSGSFFVGAGSNEEAFQRLYMCLGQPVVTGESPNYGYANERTQAYLGEVSDESEEGITVYDLDLIDDGPSEGSSTNESQWAEENLQYPFPPERLAAEQNAAQDPNYVQKLWLSQRMATRCYRAARGRFGPRKRFTCRRLGRKYAQGGPAQGSSGRTVRSGKFSK